MRIVMFYHSLLSDWNHGNAHFLRGVASELRSRGHDVCVYEPKDSWSLENLLAEHGNKPIEKFKAVYPGLESTQYDLKTLDLNEALDNADLVIVHEWNAHELVQRVGKHRASVGGYRLLFHDTHHRSVSDRSSMASYDLSNYDGVLAYGNVIRDIYLTEGWTQRAWTWHEAADTRVFHPIDEDGGVGNRESGVMEQKSSFPQEIQLSGFKNQAFPTPYSLLPTPYQGDLVWIGNWGDDERTAELYEFLIEPVQELALKARVHGVRYPEKAIASLATAGIKYAGWLPNYEVPQVFSRFKLTVHVPRRPYVKALPGIPTIRIFEALACGIPLVSAPWDDVEGLFTPGKDFLIAHTGEEMKRQLQGLLQDEEKRKELAQHGRQTILTRHTCAHRVDELLKIYTELEK
jgi:spore maturation protein CgeB